MHGSNRLGGNSLSDLLVFGKRAGDAARRTYATGSADARPQVADDDVQAAEKLALAPFDGSRTAARTRTRSSRTSSRR